MGQLRGRLRLVIVTGITLGCLGLLLTPSRRVMRRSVGRAELIDLIIKPAFDRRREDWFNGLAEDVQKLKDRPNAPTIEELSQNEVF